MIKKKKITEIIYISLLLLIVGCEEKREATVTINPKLSLPIECMKLDVLGKDEELLDTLKDLYSFDEKCDLTLTVSYKKDIVCTSPASLNARATGKFPKSFLDMKLRRGMELEYSYYIDLFSNVDSDDVKYGFSRLKMELIEPKGSQK
jgi:hypothetical protein